MFNSWIIVHRYVFGLFIYFFLTQITDDLSAAQVISACSSSSSLNNTSPILNDVIFQTSISTVYFSNAAVDLINALSGRHHFDDETFEMARDLITAGQQQSVRPSVRLLGEKLVTATYEKAESYQYLMGMVDLI